MEDPKRPQRRRRRLPPEAAQSDFAARNPDGTRKVPGSRPRGKPPTDWGNVAEWYDDLVGDEGSEFHREVILPGVLRMLAIHDGERVLDVACGQGVLSRALERKGAKVTGVDAARGLIEAAKQRSMPRAPVTPPKEGTTEGEAPQPSIDYRLLDVRTLSNVEEFKERFHAAACILAIQNMEPIRPVFEGIASSLVSDGAGRVVIVHEAHRSFGPAAEIIARLVERSFYYLEGPVERVTGYDVIVPYFAREQAYLPDERRILAACRRALSAA